MINSKVYEIFEFFAIITILGLLCLFVIPAIVSNLVPDAEYINGREVTNILSPCQCTMMGGCSITWTPKKNGLYKDKTAPEDYDVYRAYTGALNVPDRCRAEQ